MKLRCPSCGCGLSGSLSLKATEERSDPPAATSLSVVPEDRITIGERLATEAEHERWFRSAPPGTRGEVEDKLGMRMADWYGRWKAVKGRKPTDEPSEAESKHRLAVERAQVLAEFVARKRIGPREAPHNVEPSGALPVGDRDTDDEESTS